MPERKQTFYPSKKYGVKRLSDQMALMIRGMMVLYFTNSNFPHIRRDIRHRNFEVVTVIIAIGLTFFSSYPAIHPTLGCGGNPLTNLLTNRFAPLTAVDF